MSKIAFAFLASVCFATPALADVCAWNPKPVAQKAAKMLSQIDTVLSYCGPCGDTKAVTLPVTETKLAPTDDPTLFEVQVNGKGVDLAYIYSQKSPDSKRWVDFGLVVGCAEASEFDPLELPATIVDSAAPAAAQ